MREIGEIMENARTAEESLLGQKLRLSREERDYVASHALDSVCGEAQELARLTHLNLKGSYKEDEVYKCSGVARKITALSNLLGDIGWEREAHFFDGEEAAERHWKLGELFPVAQLRPWLEEWQRQDNEALVEAEKARDSHERGRPKGWQLTEQGQREWERLCQGIMAAQTKLGTGAILLARIEKWMASHGN